MSEDTTEIVPASRLRVGDLIASIERGKVCPVGGLADGPAFESVISITRAPSNRNLLYVATETTQGLGAEGCKGFRTTVKKAYVRLVRS